jgi:polysaccharide biosynthesis/export protein
MKSVPSLRLRMLLCSAFALSFGSRTLRAQDPRPAPSRPADSAAAQAAAQARLGRPVTPREITDAIARSGLSPAQVRARLQDAGYDPTLADPFLSGSATGQSSTEQASSFGEALRALGLLSAVSTLGDPTADTTVVEDSSAVPERRGRLVVFGKDMFTRGNNFDPVTAGPVDASYRLGAGDQVQLVLTGQVELAYQLEVRRDGTILVPQIGQISVAGLTLEAARTVVRRAASRPFSGVSGGTIRVDLSVSRIRTNSIFVIGEVEKPGTYQVSALATAFHALVRARGPTEKGSFRNIEVRRGGQVVRQLDLYTYLLRGDISNDVRLEQGDVIFVPLNSRSVGIEGAIRRPGIFELTANEGFLDLLDYSGGLLPTAATERLQVDRILPPDQRAPGMERAIVDISLRNGTEALKSVTLADGDVVRAFEVGNLRRNMVNIAGEVYQPGAYQFARGMTVGDLLQRAQGFLPWALEDRVKLVRVVLQSGQTQLLSLDATTDSVRKLALQEFDSLTVLDGRLPDADRIVSIEGAVRTEVTRPFSENLRVRDLVDMAGGFKEYALTDRIKIERRIPSTGRSELLSVDFSTDSGRVIALKPYDRITVLDARTGYPSGSVFVTGAVNRGGTKPYLERETLLDAIERAGGLREDAAGIRVARRRRGADFSDTTSIVFTFGLDELHDGNGTSSRFMLQRDDRVFVQTAPGYRDQRFVTVAGMFRYPGTYAVNERQDHLSDVIARAGGLLPGAYPLTFRLMRYGRPVGIDLEKALRRNKEHDVSVLNGDVISVAANQNTVLVTGQVGRSTLLLYVPGRSMDEYIDLAGGVKDGGDLDATVVDYPSGIARRVNTRLKMFRTTPEVVAGSIITVPEKPADQGDFAKTLTTIVQTASTLAAVVLAYVAATK